MVRWLPAPLAVALSFLAMLAGLLFWALLWFLPGALLKILIPIPAFRRWMTRYLVWVGQRWTGTNRHIYRALLPTRDWRISLPEGLDPRRSYLLVCNHQSWADILVLFDALHGRVPWPRFFLKRELIWVPLIGLICWALDFPFMKRHSRETLARHPERARDDLEATRRFCQRYRGEPLTLVNFLDGTRFTEAKRVAKQSPFRHLLRPKSAGLSFSLNAMGEQFAGLLDITLWYGNEGDLDRRWTLWRFLAGRQGQLRLTGRLLEIDPAWLHGDYQGDAAFRQHFQQQINQLWAEKDAALATMSESG